MALTADEIRLMTHRCWVYSGSGQADHVAAIGGLLSGWNEDAPAFRKQLTANLCKAFQITEQLLEIFENDLGVAIVQAYVQPRTTTDFDCFVIVDPTDLLSPKLDPAHKMIELTESENEDDVFTLNTTFHPHALNTLDDVLGEGPYYSWEASREEEL